MSVKSELIDLLRSDEKRLNARLIGMKLAPVCGRCGGTGSYSFNQFDGSRCYGCNGKGFVAPKEKDLPRILEDAKEAVAQGKLDEYLEFLNAHAAVKNAREKVMAAWQATNVAKTDITHIVPSEDVEGLAEYRARNKKMYDAYTGVETDSRALKPNSPTYQDDVKSLANKVNEAIATIHEADYEVPESLVENVEKWVADWQAKRK